jgi:hypothetical protein
MVSWSSPLQSATTHRETRTPPFRRRTVRLHKAYGMNLRNQRTSMNRHFEASMHVASIWRLPRNTSIAYSSRDKWLVQRPSYGLDEFRQGQEIFLFSIAFRPALGPKQSPILWVSGPLSPGVMRPGREVDRSPPCSAEVKNTWIYISISPYVILAWLSKGTILFSPY